ncbi:MAG TPA: hypothetical protein V6D14_33665 [Coleofasciculaceae cyanobacterium]
MTYDAYRNQGQQDDYFDADLAKSGNHSKQEGDYDDYREQGQQNDHFDADVSLAGNEVQEDGEESRAS